MILGFFRMEGFETLGAAASSSYLSFFFLFITNTSTPKRYVSNYYPGEQDDYFRAEATSFAIRTIYIVIMPCLSMGWPELDIYHRVRSFGIL